MKAKKVIAVVTLLLFVVLGGCSASTTENEDTPPSEMQSEQEAEKEMQEKMAEHEKYCTIDGKVDNPDYYLFNIKNAVPDEETAIQVGRAFLNAIFPEEGEKFKFNAYYHEEYNAWEITRAFDRKEDGYGGHGFIVISKVDGRIMAVWHTQ